MAEAFLWLGDALRTLGLVLLPLLLLPVAALVAPAALLERFVALQAAIDRVSGGALSAAKLAAVIMLLAQLAVVILRHVYGLAFSWLDETVIYAFAALFLLASASALRDDAHVRVDILRSRFGARMRAWIELAGTFLFIFPICVLIFWAVEPSLARSWSGLEGSRESDGLPIYFLFRTLIPLFATLLLLQGFSNALKAALGLRGRLPLDTDGPAAASTEAL